MTRNLLLAALLLGACGRPDYANGSWQCDEYADCPEGMACSQTDNYCYAIADLPVDANLTPDAGSNTLTVTVVGPGTVTLTQTLLPVSLGACSAGSPCGYQIPETSVVTITPQASSANDYFDGFTVTGATCTSGPLSSCIITPTGNVTLTATFESYATLRVERIPPGAPAVTPTGANTPFTCTETPFTDCFLYRRDEPATIDYAPGSGSFAGFASAPRSCAGRNPCAFADMSVDRDVTVAYNVGGTISAPLALVPAAGSLVEIHDVVASGADTYYVGSFTGTLTFPGMTPSDSITAVGGRDGFVARRDTTGWLWAKPLGSDGDEDALDVAISASTGNVLVGGHYGTSSTSWAPLGTGLAAVSSTTSPHIFFLLLTPTGGFDSVATLNTNGAVSLGDLVAAETAGFWAAVTFRNALQYNATSTMWTSNPPLRTDAGFLYFGDTLAVPTTRHRINTLEDDRALAVAPIPGGAVALGGSFCGDGNYDLDGMATYTFTTAGATCDGFVIVRNASDLSYRGHHLVGGDGGDEAVVDLAAASTTRLYVGVEYPASFDYVTTPAAVNVAARGGVDTLVAAYDYNDTGSPPRLTFVGLQSFGTAGDDHIGALATSATGEPTLVGWATRTSEDDLFRSTAFAYGLRIAGNRDAFAVGMTTALAASWVHIYGGSGDESAESAFVVGSQVTIAGTFAGEGGYGAGPVSAVGTTAGFSLRVTP